jgi:hypothetical protein
MAKIVVKINNCFFMISKLVPPLSLLNSKFGLP